MLDCIDARDLRTRSSGLLLPGFRHDLHQRGVYWACGLGIVLHERLHRRHDLPIDHDPSDLRRGGQRLHHHRHHDLQQWGVYRVGRLGIVLHERVHGWDDMPIGHES